MSEHAFDHFYYDAKNWKLGIFYFCRADRRLFVRRQGLSLGWTPNFARPFALPLLAFFIALAVGIIEVARRSH